MRFVSVSRRGRCRRLPLGGSAAAGFAGVLLVVLLLGVKAEAAMGIYVCRDAKGNEHFTNAPESAACVPFQRKRPGGSTFSRWSAGSKARWGAYASDTAYDADIKHYGDRYRVDPNLIKAVIKTESGFNRHAVSRRGAQGLMQLMPDTARELKVADPFNARQNIDGGTRYLRSMLDLFDGNLKLALAAYNAGPTMVRRVNRVPRIPETVRYVKRVLAYYQRYGGDSIADASFQPSIRVRGLVTVQ